MDDRQIREAVTRQFDAAFAMLAAAIEQCPADVWTDATYGPAGWKLAYHVLHYTDAYLHDGWDAHQQADWAHPNAFAFEGKWSTPPREVEVPDVVYEPDRLLAYGEEVKQRARDIVGSRSLDDPSPFAHIQGRRLDVYVYNLRHLQHHVGQLGMLTRRAGGGVVGWSRNGEAPRKPA